MTESLSLYVAEVDRSDEVPFKGSRVTIGRAKGNDISLSDRQASRVHCAVERIGGAVRVLDLGSQNGTFVNGVRVLSADLKEGDTIQVGAATIRFGLEDPEAGRSTRVMEEPPLEDLIRDLSQERAFLMRMTAVARDVAMERELMPLL
ncbi:MAG: FHA domain-containing protein, partial [Planctomycetota bacterium]